MSLDCYYFLERKEGDEWLLVKPERKNDEYDSDTIYWNSAYYCEEFLERYTEWELTYPEYRRDVREEYKEAFEGRIHDYSLLNLGRMVRDYNENIHEHDGIISIYDKNKMKRDWFYSPRVISPETLSRLPRKIRKNYVYHVWDGPGSEYGELYTLVPRVLDTMKRDGLKMDEVRLTYYWD